MLADKVERKIRHWPWSSFLSPVWAVAMIIRSTAVIITPSSYSDIAAYQVLFNLAPMWVWVAATIAVSLSVLITKSALSQILQGALVLMEGVAIFLASIGDPTVTPTAGLSWLAIAIALWLAMVRNFRHVKTPYDE